MRFGKSETEAAEEPGRGGGGSQFIRYLKDGDNTFRILQEPDEWTYYWEHFSPLGFSFPCPRSVDDPIEDCPGCSSDNEKMKKPSRKIAFNILHSFNGTEYVDVLKVGNTVADKIKNRFNRFDTVTDRDYTVTRYKGSGDRYDFDVDAGPISPVDLRKADWKDVEELLQAAWDDAWGDGAQAQANRTQSAQEKPARRVTIAATPQEEPPFEEPDPVFQEADLRAMDLDTLVALITEQMGVKPPEGCTTSGAVVDWLMSIQP